MSTPGSINQLTQEQASIGGSQFTQPLTSTGLKPLKPEKAQKAPRKRTRYEIQLLTIAPNTWQVREVVDGRGSRAALREWVSAYKGDEPLAGKVLRAVPVRHITEVTVRFETQMRLAIA